MRYTIKQANTITGGGLTQVSKMPEYTYNLPAHECNIGAELVNVEGSVCHGCYALKGLFARYAKTINPAQYARLESLQNDDWSDAMAFLINHYSHKYFRWHSSGDIQDLNHLIKICHVAFNTPDVFHWLPTREYKVVNEYIEIVGNIPANLNIRLSAHMVNQSIPVVPAQLTSSSVYSVDGQEYELFPIYQEPSKSWICPAQDQGNKCDGRSEGGMNCRACWDRTVKEVTYHKH